MRYTDSSIYAMSLSILPKAVGIELEIEEVEVDEGAKEEEVVEGGKVVEEGNEGIEEELVEEGNEEEEGNEGKEEEVVERGKEGKEDEGDEEEEGRILSGMSLDC